MRRTLPALVLLLACGGSRSTPLPPAAPQNLVAHAGDGQVTLLWDAVDGALGYRVYSQDGAAAAATSTRAEVGAVTSWTVVGLANGHPWHFAVTAFGAGGEGALSAQAVATPKQEVPLAVASFTPADGPAPVARNTKVVVHFNKPVQAQSVTAGCSGSLRLSDDGFATCAAGAITASADGSTFTFAPAAPLHESATYKLRVTADVKDANGLALGAQYSSAGFATAAALHVVSITPGGTVGQPRPSIVITFNRPVLPASVQAGGCSGTITVKTGSACAALDITLAGSVVTLVPSQDLAVGSAYAITVGAVLDQDGLGLDAPATGAFQTGGAPTATAVQPADGSVDQPFDASLRVGATFSAPLDLASLTVAADTTCTGAFQLSSDGFTTCVPLQAVAASGASTYLAAPVAALATNTAYDFRVTTAAKGAQGFPLAAPATSHFLTGPALTITALSPGASAAAPINAQLSVTFSEAVDPATVTAQAAPGPCTGSLRLSADSFVSCLGLGAVQPDGAHRTFTARPAALLAASTDFEVRLTAAVKDQNQVALRPENAPVWKLRTQAALSVTSAPADGTLGVKTGAALSFSFSRAVSGATGITSGTACGASTLQLSADPSFATCLPLQAQPGSSNAGLTWTMQPAAALAQGTTYYLRVTLGVTDPNGVALPQPYTLPHGFTTVSSATPPPAPTNLQASLTLQTAALSWTAPADATVQGFNLYVSPAGMNAFVRAAVAAKTDTAATLVVPPGGTWDFKVTAFNSNEGAGVVLANQTSSFTGTPQDFLAGQKLATEGGHDLWVTWSDSALYVGVGNGAARLLTSGRDALWIALKTTPAGGGAMARVLTTAGANRLVLPLDADTLIELRPNGVSSTVKSLAPAGGAASNVAGAGTFDGVVQEVSIPKAALGLGDTSLVQLVFAALNPASGDVFDLAPSSIAAHANNALHYFASLTAAFETPAAGLWSPAHTASSGQELKVVAAPHLLRITVQKPGAIGPLKLHGSIKPFTYGDLALSGYQLTDDGTRGDQTAGDGLYTGVFNLESTAGELFFKLNDNGADEPDFPASVDRVYTLLAPGPDALPTLTWNVPWSATHSTSLVFNCVANCGNATELREFPSSGIATLASFGGASTQVAVSLQNRDFVHAPLQFKAFYGADTSYEGGANHVMNDDVLNTRTLSFSAGDSAAF